MRLFKRGTTVQPRMTVSVRVVLVVVLLVMGLAVGVRPTAAGARTAKAPKTPFPATGYFSLGESKGRSWLVTPQGQPFYAAASDTVSPDGSGTDQVTGVCPYCQTVASNYQSTTAWGTATLGRLRSWGFNTLGAYSDTADLGSQMPYELQLTMASGNDWFSPSFVTGADNVAATQVAARANDPNLIGYFTDSESNWGVPVGSVDPLNEYLALRRPARRDWPSPSSTWTTRRVFDLRPGHPVLPGDDGCRPPVRPPPPHPRDQGRKDRRSRRPFWRRPSPTSTCSVSRTTSQPGLAQLVQRSWPSFLPVELNLANFEQYVKRPLMIGEYASSRPARPRRAPCRACIDHPSACRAQDFESFMSPLYLSSPWLVGDSWFQYVDEPQNGRPGDGENDNFGMVNVNDQPYPTMTAAMQLMHSIWCCARSRWDGTSC